ncbi:hypothetical protein ASF29_12550 [Rhizobium sp. Leaf262]|nr:hypothetical protein ASF29_12550 [Rhizobium sp. Leaf262]
MLGELRERGLRQVTKLLKYFLFHYFSLAQQIGGSACGAPPSVLPDISPTGGEIDSWLGFGHLECCGRKEEPASS